MRKQVVLVLIVLSLGGFAIAQTAPGESQTQVAPASASTQQDSAASAQSATPETSAPASSSEKTESATEAKTNPGPRVGDKLDIRELIHRSVENHKKSLDVIHNYVYQERRVEEELNKDNTVKKTEVHTYEVSDMFGTQYERLIARDDKPLSEDDARKEQEKYQKKYAELKKKSESGKEAAKQDKEEREMTDALMAMMKFTLVGEERVDRRPVWVVDAEPDPQRKPSSRAEKFISKVRGRLWIDQNEYEWVKVSADLLDDFSVGMFLLKLNKGAHVDFESTRVNDEVWLPKRTWVEGSGRLLVMSGRVRQEEMYSKYRRFKGDARVIGIAEGPPPQTPQQ